MKTKILVAYSTNRDIKFQKFYDKRISKSIGCEHTTLSFFNSGTMSLAQVYNKIWQSYPYDESYIFVFIHHDLQFKSKGWGKTLLNLFNSEEKPAIIGVAGTDKLHAHGIWYLNAEGKFSGENTYGKVWHTNNKKTWKSDFTKDKECAKLQPVVAIDGLFMAFDPDECVDFDDEVSQGFHFYDITFSIRNHMANNKIFVTESIHILHESIGQLSTEWEMNRQRFIQAYPNTFFINKDKQ